MSGFSNPFVVRIYGSSIVISCVYSSIVLVNYLCSCSGFYYYNYMFALYDLGDCIYNYILY